MGEDALCLLCIVYAMSAMHVMLCMLCLLYMVCRYAVCVVHAMFAMYCMYATYVCLEEALLAMRLSSGTLERSHLDVSVKRINEKNTKQATTAAQTRSYLNKVSHSHDTF